MDANEITIENSVVVESSTWPWSRPSCFDLVVVQT